MSWWLSLLVGVLTAVAGCLGTGLVAGLLVDWYRVSSREGASGFFVIGLALLGLVGGFVVGVVCARLVAAGVAPGFLKALGVALGATCGLLALITGLSWLSADFPPTLDGRELVVEVEVRLPAGLEIPAEGTAAPYDWHATVTAGFGQLEVSYDEITVNHESWSGSPLLSRDRSSVATAECARRRWRSRSAGSGSRRGRAEGTGCDAHGPTDRERSTRR